MTHRIAAFREARRAVAQSPVVPAEHVDAMVSLVANGILAAASTLCHKNTGFKSVIETQKDLNMRKGKLISQAASSTLSHENTGFKQMIVMRKDLNMRKGKMVAQGAHASMKATLEYMDHPYVKGWLEGSFTKVVVGVASFDALLGIYVHALRLEIPCSLVIDAGKTEFNGVPTFTAVGVGPAPETYTSAITGHLKLL